MTFWRKKLNDKRVILLYGLFFVGLTDNAYFWEIVVTNMRMVLSIMCSIFFAQSEPTLKAFVGLLIINLQTQLLKWYRPYIDPRFNRIEHHSHMAVVSPSNIINFRPYSCSEACFLYKQKCKRTSPPSYGYLC